ncbi:ImmA/IrrE family metallo-endopeptidase [Curtobacterium sp. MCBD17_019]|uniref:ImmA/IrrE family metallo-endopeptidase n=1 Tax=Curtobacterium sp. MCBD17_019 TaxID=2175669 RepID=UPI0015E88F8D|nr:ImmA/IrrE family metallo-endopeptidase [Curtobacterium sp. MCBD17_019]
MNSPSSSLLGRLRSLTPARGNLTFDEALRIAELQAAHLVATLSGCNELHEVSIGSIPRIQVVHEPLSVSGMSHWTGATWLIVINAHDSRARQRFTLLHEFKHIVDHGRAAQLYRTTLRASAALQAERAADYFAGCALVPKRDLKALWGAGVQRVTDLAHHFGVSVDAIVVRLAQTKLNSTDGLPTARCARPISSPLDGPQHFRIVETPRSCS